jgi:hypothetical protein
MLTQKVINLDRITCISISTKGNEVYLVFQDGRHNYAYRVKDVESANNAIKTIEKEKPKWWRVSEKPIEVTFKRTE